MGKLKESLLKRKLLNLEEVNELAYKYIQIEEAKKSPKGTWETSDGRNLLEKPRAKEPECPGYSRADLPRGSAFSHLKGDPKKKEVKGEKIGYLTPLNASVGNVFLEIDDKRTLRRPPRQKTPQGKRDMSKYYRITKIIATI
ncbi:hypothetical protein LIER_37104 [Lithospermum erythrorhizon]|uniref:Uncharacterized protein n=1 Tax=Lithospermum erythrorhizon TaxID=34254 RepID=A0AAV3PH66_LITER